MLARFIIPTNRPVDLAAHADLLAEHPPFRFSVLGPRCVDAADFLRAFDTAAQAISSTA